jgi:pimeloyl-ACP methyl ester carboxylesterase
VIEVRRTRTAVLVAAVCAEDEPDCDDTGFIDAPSPADSDSNDVDTSMRLAAMSPASESARLIDAVGLTRPHVVGLSFGGALGIEFARRQAVTTAHSAQNANASA